MANSIPTKSTLIEIRPVIMKKWHGLKGKESFTRPKKLRALVNPETMAYDTGLTDAEIKELGKIVNYNLSNHYMGEGNPHPFWDSQLAVIKLENNTMFLDISQALSFIKYKILKASVQVANSLDEYEEGKFPNATHYIHNEAEQADILAKALEIKEQATMAALELTKARKIEIILAITGKNLKNQSDSAIKVALHKTLEKNYREFLRFTSLDKEYMFNLALVHECIQKSVLRKDGHKILFNDALLGGSEEDVASYLKEPINNELKISLIAKVN